MHLYRIKAEVAIIFDWENWWAVELSSKPHNKLRYIPIVEAYYRELYKRNIAVDFVRPSDDLTKYKVVIAPMLYMVKEGEDENLRQFVANGGTLIVSFFSGIVDENDRVHLGGYPGPLRDILGIFVEEFVPYPETKVNKIYSNDGEYDCTTWADIIRLEGAEPLATFKGDWYAGLPAVTRNCYGKGEGIYVGTYPDSNYLGRLLEQVFAKHHINPILEVAENVEVQQRETDEWKYLIIINHNDYEVTLSLPEDKIYQNMIDGKCFRGGELRIQGVDVAVLREHDEAGKV